MFRLLFLLALVGANLTPNKNVETHIKNLDERYATVTFYYVDNYLHSVATIVYYTENGNRTWRDTNDIKYKYTIFDIISLLNTGSAIAGIASIAAVVFTLSV